VWRGIIEETEVFQANPPNPHPALKINRYTSRIGIRVYRRRSWSPCLFKRHHVVERQQQKLTCACKTRKSCFRWKARRASGAGTLPLPGFVERHTCANSVDVATLVVCES